MMSMDASSLQKIIKTFFRWRLSMIINNPNKIKDPSTDHNQIMLQIKIMYAFKIFRLVTTILILAYFIGTLFFCLSKHTTYSKDDFTFYNEYGMGQLSESDNLIRMIYFAITTLTTIGFGDFNPKSEIERIATTLILLAGVCCFSYIMNQFMEIVIDYRHVTAENQQSEELSRWLGLVCHFN
jgi:hypothetical protein